MLRSKKMLGFVLTKDYVRARKFYESVLGFKFQRQDEFALVMETDQNMIRISQVKDMVPASHTVLGWEVKEIEKVASWLRERGVVFESYPWAKTDALGVWGSPSGDKVAWFKDADGNLLSISEHVGR